MLWKILEVVEGHVTVAKSNIEEEEADAMVDEIIIEDEECDVRIKQLNDTLEQSINKSLLKLKDLVVGEVLQL